MERSGDVDEEDVSLTFPQRLMEVLDNKEHAHIVSWLASERAFAVHDKQAFTDEILPKYFNKSTKYASFARKLNRWGFQRFTKGEEAGAYYHELFQKGNYRLLARMSCGAPSRSSSNRESTEKQSDAMKKYYSQNFAAQLQQEEQLQHQKTIEKQQQQIQQQQMQIEQLQHLQQQQVQLQQQQQIQGEAARAQQLQQQLAQIGLQQRLQQPDETAQLAVMYQLQQQRANQDTVLLRTLLNSYDDRSRLDVSPAVYSSLLLQQAQQPQLQNPVLVAPSVVGSLAAPPQTTSLGGPPPPATTNIDLAAALRNSLYQEESDLLGRTRK